MNVKLIKPHNDIPEGTVLQQVSRNKTAKNGPHRGKEFFAGYWSTYEGTYLAAVPVENCIKCDPEQERKNFYKGLKAFFDKEDEKLGYII